MPSDLADSLFYRLIESFPARRVYTPAAFEREPMPAPVAHFLVHWLRHHLRHEATRFELPHSDWFDPENVAVERARRTLVNTLIENGHFPAAKWETSLREAVQQVTSYLVHPVSTLIAFVFQGKNDAMQAEVVEWRLGYFKDYTYFHEATRLYLQKQDVRDVEQGRFTELLRKVNHKITEDYDAATWLNALAPLFDLARRAGIGDGVPVALLMAFFRDKEADALADRLARYQQQRGVAALDEDRLRRVLEGAAEPVLAAAQPAMPPTTPGQEQGPVPLWKQYQLQQTTPPPQRPQPPRPKPARTPPPGPQPRRGFSRTPDDPQPRLPAGDTRPLWMQFQGPDAPEAGAEPPTPGGPAAPASMNLTEIEQAVLGEGADHRDVFVKALFARSLDAYERILQQLHATPSWAEASKIIAEDVFRAFQVNIYSDPAIMFTDAVEARYLERSKHGV